MRRRVAVFLAVAAAAVVLENVLYFRTSSPPAASTAEAPLEPSAEAAPAAAGGALGAVCEEALRDYLAALSGPGLRSAFLTRAEADALAANTPASEARAHGPMVLAGTLVSAERRVAWLDGIAASEGDAVGGFELLRIEPRAVVLRNGAEQLRIELEPPGDAEPRP